MKTLVLILSTMALTLTTNLSDAHPGHKKGKSKGHPGNPGIAARVSVQSEGFMPIKVILNGVPVNHRGTDYISFRARPGRNQLVVFAKGPRGRISKIRQIVIVRPGQQLNLIVGIRRGIGLVVYNNDFYPPIHRRGRYHDRRLGW